MLTTCQQNLDLEQNLVIDCNPLDPFSASGITFENSATRRARCYQNIVSTQKANHDLIRAHWESRGGTPKIEVSYDDEVTDILDRVAACTTKCKA